ncbi:hypothetical protein K431DRAFT_283938 [Polychaeton citri CBS 116435]|uniref:Vps72/YL1 C-terminal domain-containing protein n=1 Tax=Polychaeton citri CBS 116435 TaxID=1314669 RepID=A0A9P4URY9_9PEZI|nr:hypothetical protein K431DRAFT_283938 [Polychaeton citri CBS 116435]
MSDVDMSSSDSEDIAVTGLVATRARRANAGSLMAGLLANVDNDVELQAALAEGDDDAEGDDAASYAGSDASDVEMGDSDNEEDIGPPVDGEQEDMTGEKELRKAERKDQMKKRKAKDARLRLPTWAKKSKKVKLADDAKTEDGASTPTTTGQPRPKKKSERSSWLPTAVDAPIRQSARASAVQMREVTHANLRESAARSEKQRQMMKTAAEREDAKRKRIELTREQRLDACKRIEKETARELGRYEREEAERQRQREAILAAKRKRGLDGAFIRHWSGSGIFEGYGESWKLKIKRVRPAKLVEEAVEAEKVEAEKEAGTAARKPVVWDTYPFPSVVAHTRPVLESETMLQEPVSEISAPDPSEHEGFLEGIENYAMQQDEGKNQQSSAVITINAGSTEQLADHPPTQPSEQQLEQPQQPQQEQKLPFSYPPPIQPLTPRPVQPQSANTHNWPPGASVFSTKPTSNEQQHKSQSPRTPAPPPPPPQPVLQEQAQRSLVLLENFTNLTVDVPEQRKRNSRRSQTSAAASAAAANAELTDKIRGIILPNTIPQFTPEQYRYITTNRTFKGHRTQSSIVPPSKTNCCVTQFQARYKDPKTGLPYFDMHAYKTIQRVLAGGVMWSGLLGTWCGARYGSMGRPARGVPGEFSVIPSPKPTPAPTAELAVKTDTS